MQERIMKEIRSRNGLTVNVRSSAIKSHRLSYTKSYAVFKLCGNMEIV